MVSRLQGKLQSGEHVPDSSHRAHRRIGLAILAAAHHAHFSPPSIDVSDSSPGLIQRLRAGRVGLHRPLARGLAALCIVASSAGCLSTRDLPDPALDIPDAYKAARLKDPGSTAKLDWWRGFRSSELAMLMEEAQTVNLDIAAAVARFQQADAQARIAGAALLPSLNGSGQETYSRTSGASASGLTIGGREVVNYSASLSASYELDFWGKNREALQAAEETAVANRFDREVVALTTLTSVANAYFQVIASQDRIRTAERNIASATRVLEAIRDRLKAGTGTDVDVAQQEAILGHQKAAVPLLRQALAQNMNALATL